MTNEEKIISMLEGIQQDISEIKAEVKNTDEEKRRQKNIQAFFEAAENFRRADTPEEKAELDAFFAFMDAEEERKRAKYALLS